MWFANKTSECTSHSVFRLVPCRLYYNESSREEKQTKIIQGQLQKSLTEFMLLHLNLLRGSQESETVALYDYIRCASNTEGSLQVVLQ